MSQILAPRENQRKKEKLNPLFYVKDFGRLRFNLLKLIIYSSPIILRHTESIWNKSDIHKLIIYLSQILLRHKVNME
jgi:hypothetical protein